MGYNIAWLLEIPLAFLAVTWLLSYALREP